ncbi:MAG: hypothetical protein Tp138OMZ00d2C19078241_21 [Prokaryotic dsDNA virus sp.]|jgi:hypothetical protein|nr:MAG: hypothetical protein Tp138OMZ00d2C19078241_21 [Prokaryotic dsDNA virus sp.]|tara:strand:- start:34117 stop:35136 length:1020 start_codon:yes stop_codon:yes gene_type:complete
MLPTPQDLDPDFPLPLRGGPGEPLDTERRYFLTSPGVNQYVSIPEVTLAGDFEIEFNYSSSESDNYVFCGNLNDNSNFIANIGSRFQVRTLSGVFDTPAGSSTPFQDGRLNSVVVRRVGGVITVLVNSQLIGTSGQNTGDLVISSVGAHNSGAASVSGVISNFRISDNDTPVRFYPLDDNSTIIRNALVDAGSNLASDVITPVQKSSSDDLVLPPPLSLEGGVTYRLSLTVDNTPATATPGIVVGGQTFNGAIPEGFVGPIELLFTPTNSGDFITRIVGLAARTIVNSIAVQRVDGYGTYTNGAAADWGRFERSYGGDWQGQDLAVPPWESADQVLPIA